MGYIVAAGFSYELTDPTLTGSPTLVTEDCDKITIDGANCFTQIKVSYPIITQGTYSSTAPTQFTFTKPSGKIVNKENNKNILYFPIDPVTVNVNFVNSSPPNDTKIVPVTCRLTDAGQQKASVNG